MRKKKLHRRLLDYRQSWRDIRSGSRRRRKFATKPHLDFGIWFPVIFPGLWIIAEENWAKITLISITIEVLVYFFLQISGNTFTYSKEITN